MPSVARVLLRRVLSSDALPASSAPSSSAQATTTSSKAPTTTTTSQWVAPTTTQAAATKAVSNASSGSYSGQATFYSQGGVAGSCGTVASDSDYVVAMNAAQVSGGAHCGKTVHITNTANGKSVTATVRDTCVSPHVRVPCSAERDLTLLLFPAGMRIRQPRPFDRRLRCDRRIRHRCPPDHLVVPVNSSRWP